MIRRERGGDNGGKGWRVYRNNLKDIDNNKGEWKQGRKAGRAGVLGRGNGES